MTSRSESEKQKQIQEKCQVILGNLLREEDNKYCVDCDAKGPRWASWNLGIFLCIRCAGIHRNLGVHISKVKSVNLDTWTPEQVACLQQMGNSQARAVYEANLPDNFRRPQTDSSLEAFVRSKYEQKKYIAKEWVPPPPPKPAFDIDEEKKKEKERKKTRTKALGAVEIPPIPQQPPAALPRPHSTAQQAPTLKSQDLGESSLQKPDSSTADLLSLGDVSNNQQQSDDLFDAFLSAPHPETNTANTTTSSPATTGAETISTANSKSYDTTDLFTEMVIPNTSQSKMTKESILSLYGSQSQQTVPQVPPVYGLPSGMYISQQGYAPVGVQGFPTIPNPNVVSNGFPGVPQVAGIQIQQQMANLQLQGQMWNNSAVNVAPLQSSGIMFGKDSAATNTAYPASRGLPSNFWQ